VEPFGKCSSCLFPSLGDGEDKDNKDGGNGNESFETLEGKLGFGAL